VVKGTVTISTEDYHSFLDASLKSLAVREDLDLAIKELQVFLSFLCTRSDIENYIKEFNRQSKTSEINISGSIAKIELKI
tara:strand:+ start:62 stop:301 length:240 start_codon:yes stop_codon:yes gene_type:complete